MKSKLKKGLFFVIPFFIFTIFLISIISANNVELNSHTFSYDENNNATNPFLYYNGTNYIPINTTITNYNQNGYDYSMTQARYKLYLKSSSNAGDGTKYCKNYNGTDYCLIYQSSDYSYRNNLGSQDYISNIQSSTGIVKDNKITYSNIHSGVNLTLIANNQMLKENYILSSLPKVPAGYLGNISNVTLDFGGYIKYDGLDMYVNNILKSGDFKTDNEIEFRKDNTTLFYLPKPIAYDSNNSEINIQYEVKKQGNQIWFYVRTPYSWLEKAVYPVYIDPTIQFGAGDAVEAMAVSPLTNNTFVIAWCDETTDDIHLQFFNTTGENITEIIDVSSDVGSCSFTIPVSISSMTNNTLVVAYYDDTDDDMSFAVYYSNGTQITGETDVDTDVGTGSGGVSVSALTSTTFVIGYHDNTDQDTSFSVWYSNGTSITSEVDADTTAGQTASGGGVSVSALTSTTFVIGWFDAIDGDMTFSTYYSNGTALVELIDTDTDAGLSFGISVSALSSDTFVIGWNDRSSGDTSFSVWYSNGTAIIGETDADDNVGSIGGSISVYTLTSTTFVIGWFDDVDDDDTFSIYWTNGTLIAGQIDSSTTTTSGYGYQSIPKSNIIENLTFCNNNFIHAFAINTTNANWISYQSNGTAWDGTCGGGADTIPPTITSPRNFTQMVNLTFSQDMSATDSSGIGYYWINDTTTFNISQSGIITNLTSMNPQTYWLNYSVNDTEGNLASLEFYIELTPELFSSGGHTTYDIITKNMSEEENTTIILENNTSVKDMKNNVFILFIIIMIFVGYNYLFNRKHIIKKHIGRKYHYNFRNNIPEDVP